MTSGEYDENLKALRLTFKDGSTYVYTGIKPEVWEQLSNAVSPGAFFASKIRFNSDYPSYKLHSQKDSLDTQKGTTQEDSTEKES